MAKVVNCGRNQETGSCEGSGERNCEGSGGRVQGGNGNKTGSRKQELRGGRRQGSGFRNGS
jgi:hypothetical protein